MGAGSPWPTCGTYVDDDWLVTFSFTLKVLKMMSRGALKI
jgi:hypothetical protein